MNKEWISIEDDLPVPGEAVIFCSRFGTWCGWLEDVELGKMGNPELSWFSCDETQFVEKITHWMPFPEPYIED